MEALGVAIFILCFVMTLGGLIVKPVHNLITRRRFKTPRTFYNGGLWRIYCYATHWMLKERAGCPCCGISKEKLEVRSI